MTEDWGWSLSHLDERTYHGNRGKMCKEVKMWTRDGALCQRSQSTPLPINVSAQHLNSLRDFQTTVWLPIKFICHHEDIGLYI